MNSMFENASSFNQDLSNWDTSYITNMDSMFENASSFDQDIGGWDISNVTSMVDMLDSSGLSVDNFNSLLTGWASQTVQFNVPLGASGLVYSEDGYNGFVTLTSPPDSWNISGTSCFKEGTKILTKNGYILVEDLKIGDLVLTYNHDYKKVVHIGTSKISHFELKKRVINNLYIYTKEKFSELIEDLVITGGHSILVDEFKNEEEKNKNKVSFNNSQPIVDNKYKLLSFVDENAATYEQPGIYNIYHFSLESEDEKQFFGIYANGLLVECCSTEYLLSQSKMKIIS
jgi:surface protein